MTEVSKIYLYVPYSQKDKAKEYGAQFDPDCRLWFAPIKSNGKHYHHVNYDKLKKIFEKKQKKVPYSVPYEKRSRAKELGLHWDPEMEYVDDGFIRQGQWCSYEFDDEILEFEKYSD